MVGGRVVPLPWRPQTWGQLEALRREAGVQILDTIDTLSNDRLPAALDVVADHLRAFLGLGLLDGLRKYVAAERGRVIANGG